MTEPEYRQDDRTGQGYCPKCGSHAGEIVGGQVYCDLHGWQTLKPTLPLFDSGDPTLAERADRELRASRRGPDDRA